MSSLRNLLDQRALTNSLIEAAQGELTDEQAKELDKLERELAKKPDAIAAILKDFKATEEILARRSSDIAAARKSLKVQYERLEKYTIDNLLNNNLKELEGEEIVLRISPTAGELEIKNKELAEKLYGQTVTEIVVSKDAIKKDLKNGVDLGCAVIKQNYSLKIKERK